MYQFLSKIINFSNKKEEDQLKFMKQETILLYFIDMKSSIKKYNQKIIKKEQSKENNHKKQKLPEITSDQHKQFIEEQVVWAKIIGHPWWPSIIKSKSYPTYHFEEDNTTITKQISYVVEFFGESSHAKVDQSKIAEYQINRDYFIEQAFKQNKRFNIDNFVKSVQEADFMSERLYVGIQEPIINQYSHKKDKEVKTSIHPTEENIFVSYSKSKHQKKMNFETSESVSSLNQFHSKDQNQKVIIKNIAQYMFKEFKSKNKQQIYSLVLLKKLVIKIMKKQNILSQKKFSKQKYRKMLALIQSFKHLQLQSIYQTYIPERSKSIKKEHPKLNQINQSKKEDQKYSQIKRYILIDELGNQSLQTQPIAKYDFYIR